MTKREDQYEINEMTYRILDLIEPVIRSQLYLLFDSAPQSGKLNFSKTSKPSSGKNIFSSAVAMAGTEDVTDPSLRAAFMKLHGGNHEASKRAWNRYLKRDKQ